MPLPSWTPLALASLLAPPAPQAPGPGDDHGAGIAALSLEELMSIEVTAPSRVAEDLRDTPAAVYVLTGDEIRRAGFTSIPEALRMVPGMQVAQWKASAWDLSARGFSAQFSNQLLVMIDGVSVYTPLFAGVWWELQSVPIADVERIEVIRGPGGVVWGANAVNGVVNVITKGAGQTLGGLASTTQSTTGSKTTARYGWSTGERGALRVWFDVEDHDSLVDADGDDPGIEDWSLFKAGFRGDWTLASGDRLHLSGSGYTASIGEDYTVADPLDPSNHQVVVDDTPKNGFSLLGAWERDDSPTTTTRLQAWYSRDDQRQVDFEIHIDQLDVELQRTHRLSETNTLVWGIGDRFVLADLPGDFTWTFDPDDRTLNTPRLFALDKWRIPAADLELSIGSQLEYNDFTGFEVQPSLRAAWTPTPHQTVWGGATRAVRTPSIQENDARLNIPLDFLGNFLTVTGSKEVVSEELLAYELGWRVQLDRGVAFDLTGFYNDYDDLITLEDGAPYTQGGNTFFPIVFDNKGAATAWGVELAMDVALSSSWKLRSGYTWFTLDADPDADSSDPDFPLVEDSAPHNQVNLRSYLDLGEAWELDAGLYYVDRVGVFDTPSYVRADVRLGWRPEPGVELSLGVQNALDGRHPEDNPPGVLDAGTEVERSVYVRFTLKR